MRADDADRSLAYLDQVLRRARGQVDPRAFHFVHWGWIVLVWYPLANLLELSGRPLAQLPLGIAALALGLTLSAVRERRLASRPRVAADDPTLARQLLLVVATSLGSAAVLSGVAPAFELVEGRDVPILWGLAYANIAFMTGIVYRREFLAAGAVILLGVVLAIAFSRYNGLILGPFMGFGMIVPGRRAERSVASLDGPEDGALD